MTGPQLVKAGREILEAAGWVCGTANHNKPMPKGLKGWPLDIIAVRDNHVLFIECKGEGDRVNDAQKSVGEKLRPHVGENVWLLLVEGMDDFQTIVDWGR